MFASSKTFFFGLLLFSIVVFSTSFHIYLSFQVQRNGLIRSLIAVFSVASVVNWFVLPYFWFIFSKILSTFFGSIDTAQILPPNKSLPQNDFQSGRGFLYNDISRVGGLDKMISLCPQNLLKARS